MINNLKKFLNEDQNPKSIEKTIVKVNDLLTNQESIEYIAIQHKPTINISPDCIVLTNKRILFFYSKKLGLVIDFKDYLWMDVKETHINESILGSTFTMTSTNGIVESIDYIPKSQARKLYQFAQIKEEEILEFRRQKDLEDKRAIAGGVIVNTQPEQLDETKPEQIKEDPLLVLQKIKSLLDNQLISFDDYETKKKEILDRM